MRIETGSLGGEPAHFGGAEEARVLDLDEDAARADGPLEYDLAASLVSDELVVRGRLSARVRLRCGRCGDMFTREVREPDFVHTQELRGAGESVDLTPVMREAILLAFPAYPVCRDGCRGLCPQCGTNLNAGRCNCRPPAEFRWAALDRLDKVK